MSTDLETELRDALHAGAARITAASLRNPTAARRSNGVAGWALAAAVVLAAIAVVGALLLTQDDRKPAPAAGGDALAGTAWQVVSVTATDPRWRLRLDNVEVEFWANGRFRLQDGINYLAGAWAVTGDQLRVTGLDNAFAGTEAFRSGQPLTIRVSGHRLTLTSNSVRMELVQVGRLPLPGYGSAAAEPSATRSGGASGPSVNRSEVAPPS